ncbi:hypothetical protein Hypma_006831 [Hypsizygus marmoreus]|uniref:LysM domain-containing protein n=1 Tax=Hypsizygus marmoreus TaxID=39966 RepID=A0A369JZT6_HYPMA|nr:hypothetical protein Hypma_006831 [Hypsizygus marmoreus]
MKTPKLNDEKLDTEGAAEPSPAEAIQRPSAPHEDPKLQHPLRLRVYQMQKNTLQGIVLRFRVDPHELCRLNNLPPSTLHSTPHLLHTRGVVLLPPSAHQAPTYREPPEVACAREERRGPERAEKCLQTMTKEEEEEEGARKMKEQGVGRTTLEARAIERYFDDDEWEAGQRRNGGSESGSVSLWGRANDKEKEGDGRWWTWGSG